MSASRAPGDKHDADHQETGLKDSEVPERVRLRPNHVKLERFDDRLDGNEPCQDGKRQKEDTDRGHHTALPIRRPAKATRESLREQEHSATKQRPS